VILGGSASASHPRPKSATPMYLPTVTSFTACTSPNTSLPPPRSFAACTAVSQTSPNLTIGTPDANGAPANSVGSVRMSVLTGDIRIIASITDVRCKAGTSPCPVTNAVDGADYAGELQGSAIMRITDHNNAPTSSGPFTSTATVVDVPFIPFTIPCAATASTTIGATCSVSTTANTLIPGVISAGKRMNIGISQMRILDGGPDGSAATSPNSVFEVQGVFVP
jgi:hypothetical protein